MSLTCAHEWTVTTHAETCASCQGGEHNRHSRDAKVVACSSCGTENITPRVVAQMTGEPVREIILNDPFANHPEWRADIPIGKRWDIRVSDILREAKQ